MIPQIIVAHASCQSTFSLPSCYTAMRSDHERHDLRAPWPHFIASEKFVNPTYIWIFFRNIKHHSHYCSAFWKGQDGLDMRQGRILLFYLKKQRPQSPSAVGDRTASWNNFKAVGEIKTQRLTDLCCPSDSRRSLGSRD